MAETGIPSDTAPRRAPPQRNARRQSALRVEESEHEIRQEAHHEVGREHRDPAAVLVSNNPYARDSPLAPGTRPALDTDRLGIVVLGDTLPPDGAWTASRQEVSVPAAVHAGVDGEAVDLSSLRFAIRPAALRVRISSRHPGALPSARLHFPGSPARPRGSQDQLSDQFCDSLSILTSYSRKG